MVLDSTNTHVLIQNFELSKNAIISGQANSWLIYVSNMKKHILILRKGTAHVLDNTKSTKTFC